MRIFTGPQLLQRWRFRLAQRPSVRVLSLHDDDHDHFDLQRVADHLHPRRLHSSYLFLHFVRLWLIQNCRKTLLILLSTHHSLKLLYRSIIDGIVQILFVVLVICDISRHDQSFCSRFYLYLLNAIDIAYSDHAICNGIFLCYNWR